MFFPFAIACHVMASFPPSWKTCRAWNGCRGKVGASFLQTETVSWSVPHFLEYQGIRWWRIQPLGLFDIDTIVGTSYQHREACPNLT